MTTGLARLVPAPLLSASLLGLWLALGREITPGRVLLGIALALLVPRATARLRPTKARVRRPLVVTRFILRVGRDVLVSNLQVGWGVLIWRWRKPCARFVDIPLELRDPHGLASLAMVTTVIPGTVWSELAPDRSTLRLHVWHVPDEAAFVARYKARYEKPLQEIFE